MKNTPHHLYLILGALLLVVLIAGGGFALFELGQIERNANKSAAASAETLAMVNQALKGTHANGDDGYLVLTERLLQNANGAANAIKQVAQDANRIGKTQEKKTAALADASISAVNAGGAAVAKLGDSLELLDLAIRDIRGTSLPKIDASVDSLNGLLSDFRPTATASTKLMQEATVDVIAARHLLLDPNLPATLANFTEASAVLVQIEKHLNGTAADVQFGVHAMFNPKKTTFWGTLVLVGAKAVLGSAAGPLISHFWPTSIDIKNSSPVPVVIR